MKKFDGILICSDVDGTFAEERPFAQNIEAVQYFIQNGGRFTFITGRGWDFLRMHPFCDLLNAPTGLYNGGIIYDYHKEEVLYQQGVDFTVREFTEAIGNSDELTKIHVFQANGEHLIFCNAKEMGQGVLASKPLKIVCNFQTPQGADAFRDRIKRHPLFAHSYLTKAWALNVEVNGENANKGHVIQFLKNHIQGVHTAIGIGNYENDIELLKQADIGVAVGDAQPSVKEVAKVVVKPCNQYGIADLITRLDQNMLG